jgi:hypothetical protein
MDSQLFRVTTNPNYYPSINDYIAAQKARKTVESPRGGGIPAPDARFPGWAAPLEDGRLVTDYRPHCNRNIPAGYQYATTQFIQHNADNIIKTSRRRQAQQAGAVYPFDTTVVPPFANTNTCTPMGCDLEITGIPLGIGMKREGAIAPPLFGTFTFPPTRPQPVPKIELTRVFEGGRNTVRGRLYQPLGTVQVGKVNRVPNY